MKFDEEANAIGSKDVMLNKHDTMDGNNARAGIEPAKGGKGFTFAAAALMILAATAFSTHDDSAFIKREPVFEAPSISFHPERRGNPALTTSDDLAPTATGNDFVKGEINLFDWNSSDPLNDIINFGFSPEMDIESEMSIGINKEDIGTRVLSSCSKSEPDYLMPLPCNEGVEFDCTSTPLSSLQVPTDGSPLVIECGTCVYVDTSSGEQLDLPNGLRVEGKLYFPPESSITIRTIYVMVLGILKMDTPLVGNEVKFSLHVKENVAAEEQDIFFHADPEKQDPRTSQCLNGCKIGKKVIAVVGGQLDIQGVDQACPSWENLLDISSSEAEAPTAAPTISGPPTVDPNSVCGGNLITNGDFSAYSAGASDIDDMFPPWRLNNNGVGMDFDIYEDTSIPSNVAVQISNRPDWAYGLRYKFQDEHEACFRDTEQKWQLEMDVRLIDKVTNEGLECDPTNDSENQCPFLTFRARKNDMSYHWNSYKDEGMEWNKDGWSHFSVVFETPEAWLDLRWMDMWTQGGPGDAIYVVDNISLKEFYGSLDLPDNNGVVGDNGGGDNNQIHLSTDAAECWTQGSEILITSNTRKSKDYQLATIDSTDPNSGTIKLTSSIDPVSTIASDPNHAVEVALLSRRIVFEADDDDDDDLIGGHLIVLLTQTVQQHLEGVEIRNFGQQGNLGRYPVHFHMCNNVDGSEVKKNVVRQSNQRCYVMHGSNGVVIEDNVAFDTFGHCYMTEDGFERDNRFIRNLGAHIKNIDKERKLDEASGRKESDDLASVFWMTNMENYFEGNVAAGSEMHGYWAEVHAHMGGRGGSCYQREDFVPHYANSFGFKDNVAHSFESSGFTSYPPGWLPPDQNVIENFRAYRGDKHGVFVHNTQNLSFKGGYLASTGRIAFVVFGADNIIVDGMELVGYIDGEDVGCRGGVHEAIVIYPHVATVRSGPKGVHFGTKLKNLSFRNWPSKENCIDSVIEVSTTQVRSPGWDTYNLLENTDYDNSNPTFFSACGYETAYAPDAAIEVSTGTMYGEPGYLVGSNMVSLADPANTCTDVGGCLHFCPGSCLRTVKFETSGARDVWGDVMKVSDGATTITVDRWYSFTDDQNKSPNMEHMYNEHSTYSVSLPAGSFTVWFEDESGVIVYPKFVGTVFAPEPSCSGFATKDSITILKPPTDSRCDEMIHNGDFTTNIDGWQEWGAKSFFSENAGMDGTGALVTKESNPYTVTQWLDTSCLVDGVYLFQAFYRQVDQVDDIDSAQDIQNPSRIPHANILFRKWHEEDQKMHNGDLPAANLEPIVVPTGWVPESFASNAPIAPYEWVGDRLKCPEGDKRLMKNTETYSLEGCHVLCTLTTGCDYFSYNSFDSNPNNCILCDLDQDSELSDSSASDYRAYRLLSYEWVGDMLKCPEGDKRLTQNSEPETDSLEACYEVCSQTSGCNYFSYDSFKSDTTKCILCNLDEESELSDSSASDYQEHYRAYRLISPLSAVSSAVGNSLPELYRAGNNGSPAGAFPLGVCQGDCDRDSDCQDGLRCMQRNGYESVIGCSGEGTYGTDYCYDPFYSTRLHTSDMAGLPFALDVCEGDCDTDLDCKYGLVCMQRDGTEPVPGCVGDGESTKDYCYDPNLPELTGWEVFSGAFRVTPEQATAAAARVRFHYFASHFILDKVSLVKAPWS